MADRCKGKTLSLGLNNLKDRITWRDIGVEIFSTFLMVSVQCALPMQFADSEDQLDWSILTKTALAMGFIVICMIETFGHMGGAHMNPAVSISMAVAGEISVLKGNNCLKY